jgi:hypothetical protein
MSAWMRKMKIMNNKIIKKIHQNQRTIQILIEWFLQEYSFRKNIRFIHGILKELKNGNQKFNLDMIIFTVIYKTKR